MGGAPCFACKLKKVFLKPVYGCSIRSWLATEAWVRGRARGAMGGAILPEVAWFLPALYFSWGKSMVLN